ncbi:MAG: excinuclease ABC subunit UvrC [Oscillospiraceae bacterium]|nr:excinuclease ABC subunit UvrC [Oscillospiraceae bacterium]
MNTLLDSLHKRARSLPLSPGVYIMKDKKGKIIYIGKAKQLKNRVSTYFIDNAKRDRKTQKLVERINDFDYIVTPKEIDAFVLETSLIKQHRPKYNILLKDARGFNYIKITGGAYPRLRYVLQANEPDAEYIGPYVGGFFVKQSVEDANRIFMLPSCNRRFPDDFNKARPCLNYGIKRCMGVCLGKIPEDEYKSIVEAAVDYIKKGSKASVAALTIEMENAAEKLNFEKAARIRDRIAAMKSVDTVQSVIASKLTDYDVIASFCDDQKAAIAVVKYSGGRLVDKESFYIGDEYDLQKMFGDFLLEYYSETAPTEIYIETELEDIEIFEEYFRNECGHKVKLITPKRGEGLSQIMLAKSNAAEFLTLKIGRKSKELTALDELSGLLGLKKSPKYIECYDISNIGESTKVGGMVVFKDGKPFKAAYRKFTIKDVEGLDDYGCMKEVIQRRFSRYNNNDEGFSTLPDLILLDGGIGHVSAVKSVLDGMNIDVRLFGLVKDSRHKTRAVVATGEEIQIKANKNTFTLLTKIQEEVHRFSVTFAREKHKKDSFALSLTDVPGIGEAKAAALLKRFKTKQALKQATIEQLREAAKINQEKAEELKKFIDEAF